jgi:hypothetical protein
MKSILLVICKMILVQRHLAYIRRMIRIVFLLLILVSSVAASAQIDTLFWFVAPEATSGHGDAPVTFRMAAFGDAAQVIIDQPANPMFMPLVTNIAANSAVSVDVTAYLNLLENQPADQVLNKGIRIRSNAFITAYYEIITSCQCNPEIFALKGKNALGTEFYTPFQTAWGNGNYFPIPYASADIVATEDNTVITITPTTAVIGHAAGIPYEITLNQGQTYSMAAQYTSGPDHPAGSYIASNKPIAITIKDDSVGNGSCYDIMGDQLIPTELIGTDYIVMKGFLYDGAGEAIYVLATQDNTDVFIDGSTTPSATINTGQQWSYLITNPSTYVTTSAPAYILHATGEGCELAEAVLPPIECTGSRKVYFVRSVDGAFGVNIMTRAENIGNFTLNGNAALIPAASFNAVAGSAGEWASTQILFSTTDIPSEEFTVVENSTGLFHLGTINGGGGGCRYGYFSDFGQSNPLEISASFCEGDTITIQPNDDYLSYQWSTGDTTAALTVSEPGEYSLTVETSPNCIDSDTIQVEMFLNPLINLALFDTLVCDDPTPVAVSAPSGFDVYTWLDADNVQVASGQTALLTEGRYNVIALDTNGCYWPSIAPVIVDFEECELIIPNIITPDGPAGSSISQSNDNNAFFVKSLRLYPNSKLTVYNRWGNKVYHSDDYENDWVPRDMPDGTYYYVLQLRQPNGSYVKYAGDVTILNGE